jgi:GrpB-like predicted nucleotidyltransferase (UPF0157 family)
MLRILLEDYNPQWPELFRSRADKIGAALGSNALQVEHVGSTSVPDLAAKPIIDILLAVADSADEGAYAPALESASYILLLRERDWYEHRLFKGTDPVVNLHVFSAGCPEIKRMILFRDWLRRNHEDRDLYAATKRASLRNNGNPCRIMRMPKRPWSMRRVSQFMSVIRRGSKNLIYCPSDTKTSSACDGCGLFPHCGVDGLYPEPGQAT